MNATSADLPLFTAYSPVNSGTHIDLAGDTSHG
jgi:hypothetical protein